MGNPLSIVKDYRQPVTDSLTGIGFLNWRYNPLDEINAADITSKISNTILRGAVKYTFSKHLNAEIQYQNEKQQEHQQELLQPANLFCPKHD